MLVWRKPNLADADDDTAPQTLFYFYIFFVLTCSLGLCDTVIKDKEKQKKYEVPWQNKHKWAQCLCVFSFFFGGVIDNMHTFLELELISTFGNLHLQVKRFLTVLKD